VAKLHLEIPVAAIAAALALAGCSGVAPTPIQPPTFLALGGYPPWTLNQSPDGIALRWYPDVTSRDAADRIAQIHCGSLNKSAVLVSDARDGSVELAEYHCR